MYEYKKSQKSTHTSKALPVIILYSVIGLPTYTYASGDYTLQIQQLDAQIAKLQAQNEADLAKLKQCEKKAKGFKIAGISTIALTGVGIGVNIAESKKLKKLDSEITSLGARIKTLKEDEKIGNDASVDEDGYIYNINDCLVNDEKFTCGVIVTNKTSKITIGTVQINGTSKCSKTDNNDDEDQKNIDDQNGNNCWCKIQLVGEAFTNLNSELDLWEFAEFINGCEPQKCSEKCIELLKKTTI